MAALISLLIAIAFFLLITRIAAEALVLTGLSRQSAEFQARSAVLVRVPLRLAPTRGRTALLVRDLRLESRSKWLPIPCVGVF